MANRIGTETLTDLIGAVPVMAGGVEVIEVPGEDDYIRRRLGRRAEPFQLVSHTYHASEVEGYDKLQVFRDMADSGSSPFEFEKDSINYTTDPTKKYRVNVLNVEAIELAKRGCVAGVATNLVWHLIARWTLILAPG